MKLLTLLIAITILECIARPYESAKPSAGWMVDACTCKLRIDDCNKVSGNEINSPRLVITHSDRDL